MLVSDVMTTDYLTIPTTATMREAAGILSAHGISDIVVEDADGRLAGVFTQGDLLRACVPGPEDLALLADGSLVEAFAMLEQNGRHIADQPIERLVIREPIVVAPGDPLLNAITVMLTMHVHGLPVVEDGRVVGRITRAHACQGLLDPDQTASKLPAASS